MVKKTLRLGRIVSQFLYWYKLFEIKCAVPFWMRAKHPASGCALLVDSDAVLLKLVAEHADVVSKAERHAIYVDGHENALLVLKRAVTSFCLAIKPASTVVAHVPTDEVEGLLCPQLTVPDAVACTTDIEANVHLNSHSQHQKNLIEPCRTCCH